MTQPTTMVQVFIPTEIYESLWEDANARDTTVSAIVVEQLRSRWLLRATVDGIRHELARLEPPRADIGSIERVATLTSADPDYDQQVEIAARERRLAEEYTRGKGQS